MLAAFNTNVEPMERSCQKLVGRKLGLGPYQVNRKALDAAYSEAYPESEPLNIGNRRTNRPRGKREKKPP
jgi:hypothetical protein